MILDVGNIVYNTNGSEKFSITRVTAKRAYARVREDYELEFIRDIDNKISFCEYGTSSRIWGKPYYSLETPELAEKYSKYKILREIGKVNFSLFSLAKLEKILSVIKE